MSVTERTITRTECRDCHHEKGTGHHMGCAGAPGLFRYVEVEYVPADAYRGAVEDIREALRLGEWEGVEMREDMQRLGRLKAKYGAPSDFGGQ